MPALTLKEQIIINYALSILTDVFTHNGVFYTCPDHIKEYCRLEIGYLEHEVFGILFLTNRHQLIKFETPFRGTINGASVHPREIVKETLACNASAVVFTHNHPSGVVEPSEADRQLTTRLIAALKLIDVRVLDHIVCSSSDAMSFAERGWL